MTYTEWCEKQLKLSKLLGKEHFCQKKFWSVTLNILAFLFLAFCAEGMTVFCHPTLWAACVFGYCLLFYLISYFLDKSKVQIIWGFSSGLFVMVFLYLICFIISSDESFLGYVIGGCLFWLPVLHFLGRVICEYFLTGTKQIKIAFIVPFAIGLCVLFTAGVKFNKSAQIIEQTSVENYENLSDDFMTEHIVGMHFKYYSKCCTFDGWRPPVHEPFFIMGLWMNGMKDPLKELRLGERLALYKKLYPDKPYKMDCACENPKWLSYDTDKLWTGEREY